MLIIHNTKETYKYFYCQITHKVPVIDYVGNSKTSTVVYLKNLLFFIPNRFESTVFYNSIVPLKRNYSQQQPFPHLTKSSVSVNTSHYTLNFTSY